MLELKHVYKTFLPFTVNEKKALIDINLKLNEGDFVSVIGGNGAGKSSLLNCTAGVYPIDGGEIVVDGANLSKMPEHQRAQYLGRVFQDPMLGTAANMAIEENLACAYRRGKRRSLRWGITHAERDHYKQLLAPLGLGLEDRLTTKAGLLSGGQRQALTLLMATLQKPQVLLLDEHTAALDPKTAKTVLDLTTRLIQEQTITTMMITHNMRDALKMGNRLIMMNHGKIILDVDETQKKTLTVEDLLECFEKAAGEEFLNDRVLLS